MNETTDHTADVDQWRTYDEFAAGIDTYRLPNASLAGEALTVILDAGTSLALRFDTDTVAWQASGAIAAATGTQDPYDAVAVRPDVLFVNLPRTSVEREALTLVYSRTTSRAVAVRSVIGEERDDGEPRVRQVFLAGRTDAGPPVGPTPGPSRDLIGKRNVYRYSPQHLYEHIYVSSQRYAWQCLEGVQRGHGDMDLSTVWKFDDGLYVFCFREFRIAVASVWLHDLSYQLRTTGIFLGLTGDGRPNTPEQGGTSIRSARCPIRMLSRCDARCPSPPATGHAQPRQAAPADQKSSTEEGAGCEKATTESSRGARRGRSGCHGLSRQRQRQQ